MPILYNIDINFNIVIFDFTDIANISGISNYIKVWNKANGEGVNNNGWGGVNNNEDGDNREDISGIRI